MSYKRLTKRGGFSMDLDLSQELGYSHIYQRLSELEDKIEDGEQKERTKIEMPSERAAKDAAKLFVEYGFCTHVGKEKKSTRDTRYSFFLEIWKEK